MLVALLQASPSAGLALSRLLPTRAVAPKLRASELSMQAFPRVVVTGMGIVSCLGSTLDEVSDALYNCAPGIKFCEEFAGVGMKSQVSGMPTDFDW